MVLVFCWCSVAPWPVWIFPWCMSPSCISWIILMLSGGSVPNNVLFTICFVLSSPPATIQFFVYPILVLGPASLIFSNQLQACMLILWGLSDWYIALLSVWVAMGHRFASEVMFTWKRLIASVYIPVLILNLRFQKLQEPRRVFELGPKAWLSAWIFVDN